MVVSGRSRPNRFFVSPIGAPGQGVDRTGEFRLNRDVAGSLITVGFLYVGPLSRVAQIMVASVRAAMPGARIVQMTDYATKPVTGVDEAIRKRWDGRTLMTYRLEHLKDFPPGDAVFL